METKKDLNPDRKPFNIMVKKCWDKQLEWASWMCDPEGPSPSETILKFVLRWIGIISVVAGIIGWIITFPSIRSLEGISLPFDSILRSDVNLYRYLASAFVFFGSGFFFVTKHTKRVALKTAVFNEEIDSLISEVRRCAKSSTLCAEVEREIEILEYFKVKPSEVPQLRLITLRKLHVELITDFEKLKAYAESDISEYENYTGLMHPTYLKYRNSFNELYKIWDLNVNQKSVESEFSVRLKELRKDLSWEKYWSGVGEAILESITH